MKSQCRISGRPFEITDEELEFTRRMGVPAPTLHPDERAQRRMAFANQRALFHRVCAGSGKKVITNATPEAQTVIYDIEFWYSDKWDMFKTGREFDFTRSFFEQYGELMKVAPRPNLQRNPQYDENSDYTNYAGKNKNCYLIFDSDKNRDCLYSYSINSCTDVMDCFRCEGCELCVECVDCTKCYDSKFLQNCDGCTNSAFLKNCIGCNNCFGSVNLRNKSYYFYNEKLSAEEYKKRLAEKHLESRASLQKLIVEFQTYASSFPQRYMQGVQNEDVSGDYLSNCKNAHMCFDSRALWDCRNVQQAFDSAKDCQDCTEVGDGVELLYECCYTGYGGQNNRFCSHCLGQTSNLTYCYFCPHCSDCFGCVGLHHAKFCILNKQYSEADYKALVAKIIAHMQQTKEWGEFFPAALSPVPYNLSHAFDFYPLKKEEALRRGYTWHEADPREYQSANFTLPDTIAEVDDAVLQKMLQCERTKVNFKVQRAELSLSRRLDMPLSTLSPNERFLRRMALRNPRTLYERKCSRTGVPILTSFSPNRTEEVLCEEAFQQALD